MEVGGGKDGENNVVRALHISFNSRDWTLGSKRLVMMTTAKMIIIAVVIIIRVISQATDPINPTIILISSSNNNNNFSYIVKDTLNGFTSVHYFDLEWSVTGRVNNATIQYLVSWVGKSEDEQRVQKGKYNVLSIWNLIRTFRYG